MSKSSDYKLLYGLLGGTVYTSMATAIRIVSGIAGVKILTVYLPSSDFGTAALIELVATFLRMMGDFNVGISAIRSLGSAGRENQRVIIDTVIVFRFVTAILIGILFLFTQPLVYKLFGQSPVENLAVLILGFMFVLAYQKILKELLQGMFRFKQMAFIELGSSVLNVLLIAAFVVWFHMGLVGAVLAQIISIGAACVAYYVAIPTKKGLGFNVGTMKGLLHFGWALQLNDILTYVFSSFGTFTVAAVMTPSDVALLDVASKIPTNVRRFYESFRTVYFPNLSNLIMQGERERAQKVLDMTVRGLSFVMVLGTVIMMVFQRELILFFFSEKYLAIEPIFTLSMLSTAIGLIGNILGNSTVAAGNSKAPATSNVVNTTVTVVSNLVLVPPFGIMGATIATMLGRLTTNPLNVWFLRRAGFHPKTMDYVKPLALFGALYALYWWLSPESWALRLLFLPAFFIGSFALSIITVEDVRILWNSFDRIWGHRVRRLFSRQI